MDKKRLRQKASRLRKKGKTYSEIQKILKTKIPKSTLSYWSKGIILPAKYKSRLKKINDVNLKKGRETAAISNRNKNEMRLKMLKKRNICLLKKIKPGVQKLILATLYLGEGAKYKSTRNLNLASSDPKIIKFFLKLLKNCYNIDAQKLRVRIQCRFDQNVHELERFWRAITKIREEQFYPTYIDKRTEGKKTTKKEYRGVCSVYYFNTEIQLELELLAGTIMDYVEGL